MEGRMKKLSKMVMKYNVVHEDAEKLIFNVDYDCGHITIEGDKNAKSVKSVGDLPFSDYDLYKIESIVIDSMKRNKRLPSSFVLGLG